MTSILSGNEVLSFPDKYTSSLTVHGCHLELEINSLTHFVQLLHKHRVRWTEMDVLKIVSVMQEAESSLEWKERRAAGRLPAENTGVRGGNTESPKNQ